MDKVKKLPTNNNRKPRTNRMFLFEVDLAVFLLVGEGVVLDDLFFAVFAAAIIKKNTFDAIRVNS